MQIKENMLWPPMGLLNWKMAEHSAWYSGDAEVLANFYTDYATKNVLQLPYSLNQKEAFWGRQVQNQGDIFVHVPIAGDIAATSADFLFSEGPIIRLANPDRHESLKQTQMEFDTIRTETLFDSKILEAAETAAAIGGTFIKLAWDKELSKYPMLVVEQPDRAIPEFKFGILTAVTFWKVVEVEKEKYHRLLEKYTKDGNIEYTLYRGTADRLGFEVDLKSLEVTKDIEPLITTGIKDILAVYIPNILPNRLDRTSYLGRSDYSGIEGLMDSLDETFSCWMRDVVLAQPRILIPEQFLKMKDGKRNFNIDQLLYVQLDVDPVSMEGKQMINPQQFDIRAEKFEKTIQNLMERIISSAGYSPQSFGLNIEGRAESGTALSLRERKSFSTKGKKENYWHASLKKLSKLILLVYKEVLSGKVDIDVEFNIEFNDGIMNDMQETAQSLQMLDNAKAISTLVKVQLLHPDWEEEQVMEEVARIESENKVTMPDVFGNYDYAQLEELEDTEGGD